MSNVPGSKDTEISNFSLPVPYVTQYTDRTPTLGPLLLTVLKAWAVLMIEWGSLRWVDHAPVSVWIASTVVAVLVLGVIEKRDWLNFKNRRYFPVSLSVLMIIWASIVAFAYYLDATSGRQVDPVVSNLQSQVASARRDRDIAILERDAARREHTGAAPSNTPSQPAAALESIKADDIEARIDVWKSIEGQMNDFTRILGEGDQIVANWKNGQATLSQMVADFRQHLGIVRGRLGQLIVSNPDFSDIKIVDQGVPSKLAAAIENLLQTSTQLPQNTPFADYEITIGPYIGPLRRELQPVKQWANSTKNVANSSVSELSLRQVSK